MSGPAARLRTEQATFGYDGRVVVDAIDLAVPDGAFTAIVGPNACGKSTLLRGIARLLPPTAGRVLLDGRELGDYRPKDFARIVGLLPQTSVAPDGITVADLVARGRYPYQGLLRQWSTADEQAVGRALDATRVQDLAKRLVQELSGGQRQRVWAAMALAQEPSILLLDEPTTYLDMAHQYELLDLFARLRRDAGTTIVAVLHDLTHAARYADHVIAMKDGAVVASGPPAQVITADLVEQVFGLPCIVMEDPLSGTPMVVARPRP